MRIQVCVAVVGCLTVTFGCGSPTTGSQEDRPWQLDLSAADFEPQTQLGRTCRMVNILENESTPVVPPWSARLDMFVQRDITTGSERISVVDSVNVAFTLDEITPDLFRLIIDGTYADTLFGRREAPGGFRGDWSCGPDFLLANAEELLEAGFDPSFPVQGSWVLGPIPPPG